MSSTTWSSSAATSDMSIDPQEHCVERQQQRRVSQHEIKRTVKHGVPELDPQGNARRVKRSFEGVTVITEGAKQAAATSQPVNGHLKSRVYRP